MEKEEIAQQIIARRDTVDLLIHENYHRLAQKYDLSLDQFHLLIELDDLMLDVTSDTEAPTIGSLAKNISVSQNTVSERVTRLEKKGLLKRVMDTEDRRINHVVLTEEGRKVLKALSEEAETDFVHNALIQMQPKELQDFLTCYDKLIAILTKTI